MYIFTVLVYYIVWRFARGISEKGETPHLTKRHFPIIMELNSIIIGKEMISCIITGILNR